jgi:hypothetical protein
LQQQRVVALRQDRDDAHERTAGLREDLADAQRKLDIERAKNARLASDLQHAEALALRESHWAEVIEKLGSIETALRSRDKP